MSFGFQRQKRVFVHDSATLVATLYEDDDETLVPLTALSEVQFSLLRPLDIDVEASLTVPNLNKECTFTVRAIDVGANGNSLTLTILDPGVVGPLSVSTVGSDVTVTLASDGVAPTSTANQVIAAINNSVGSAALMEAEHALGSTATGIVAAMAQTNLSGGTGPIIYRQPGAITADGTGVYTVPFSIITVPGQYLGMARFLFTNGGIKSVPVDFDAVDAFEDLGTHPADPWIDLCWKKLEDCFDSELGGPWLRDMTMARFDKSKVRKFIPETVMDINLHMPQTNFTEDDFPYNANDGGMLFSQGLLVGTIRHLMRSYTEQPDVTANQFGFLDRKRYQQAWKSIYDVEMEVYKEWRALYKRHLYDLGSGSMLVSTKAGRLINAPMRARYAGRGYW